MNLIPLLIEARDLIIAGWTRYVPARNAKGDSVSVYSEEACQFCALGALHCVSHDRSQVYSNLVTAMQQNLQLFFSIMIFNDDPQTKKSDIVALFDKTIESLKLKDNN